MNFLGILEILAIIVIAAAIGWKIYIIIRYKGMKYHWLTFRKQGVQWGLSKKEIKLLRDMAFNSKLKNFNAIYNSEKMLDTSVVKSINILKNQNISEEYRHKNIEEIFLLRSKIDNIKASIKNLIRSTKKLKVGQEINLTFARIGTFNSIIAENNQTSFAAQIPTEALDNVEFTWKGKKVDIAFMVNSDAEYKASTKVLEQNPSGHMGLLLIAHVDKLTRIQKRLYRRNTTNLSVDMYVLKATGTGNKRRIAVANDIPFSGMIRDISAGGVAIQAKGGFQENTLIKISFSLDLEKTEVAIGRVLACTNVPNSNGKMLHIKIERISKKTRNSIFEYIYIENKNAKTVDYTPKTIIPGLITPAQ